MCCRAGVSLSYFMRLCHSDEALKKGNIVANKRIIGNVVILRSVGDVILEEDNHDDVLAQLALIGR